MNDELKDNDLTEDAENIEQEEQEQLVDESKDVQTEEIKNGEIEDLEFELENTEEDNTLTKKTKTKYLVLIITMVVSLLVYLICKIFDPLKNVYESEIQTSQIVKITVYIMIATAVVAIIGIVLLVLYLVKVLKFNNEKILSKVNEVLDWFVIFPICIMIVSICFSFLFTFTVVDGDSMKPNLVNGEQLLLTYTNKKERFDIVVIEVSPYYNSVINDSLYVKRIIGLPGDHIEFKTFNVDGVTKSELFINGEYADQPFYDKSTMNYSITNQFYFDKICENNGLELVKNNKGETIIPDGYYLVLGDNRLVSKDSRVLGLIRDDDILGVIKYKMNTIFSYDRINEK